MSILIKGLDMPKLNSVHEFLELTIWADGIVYARAVNAYSDTQLEDITAIQIPTPHGRLIDAEALDEVLRRKWNYFDHGIDIANAPTIIEAEDTEEINCKDCKHYTKKGDRWGECGLYNNAVDQMYSCVDAK